MLFFILFFVNLVISNLFAGNGLETFEYTIDGKIINMNCTTNDDCYELLCSYMFDPTQYAVIVQPIEWNGNCSELNQTDNRQLASYVDAFNGRKYTSFNPLTVSDTSILLCTLGQNKSIIQIQYLIYDCTL